MSKAFDRDAFLAGLNLDAHERVFRITIKGPRTVEAIIGHNLDLLPEHRGVYRNRYVRTAAGWTFRRALPMTKWGMDQWKEHR